MTPSALDLTAAFRNASAFVFVAFAGRLTVLLAVALAAPLPGSLALGSLVLAETSFCFFLERRVNFSRAQERGFFCKH